MTFVIRQMRQLGFPPGKQRAGLRLGEDVDLFIIVRLILWLACMCVERK